MHTLHAPVTPPSSIMKTQQKRGTNDMWQTTTYAAKLTWIKNIAQDFPGSTVVKNSPANSGDTGEVPGPGRSHTPWATQLVRHNYWALRPWRLSPRATTTQVCAPTVCAPQLGKPPQREVCPGTETNSSPQMLATTRKKPLLSNKDPAQPKIKSKLIQKEKDSSQLSRTTSAGEMHNQGNQCYSS